MHPRSRPSLWALIEIYRRLLTRIERSNFDVLEKRIRVPTWEKLSILASAALRLSVAQALVLAVSRTRRSVEPTRIACY